MVEPLPPARPEGALEALALLLFQRLPTDTALGACLSLRRLKADDHNSLMVFLIRPLGVLPSKTFLVHCSILTTTSCF